MASTIDLRGLVRPQLVEATKREDNPNVAEFRLQPLERGFGHTLGNAMRRMLLSSLRGSAVWGVRIDGVVHEHQTIPGVVEDVHQIIGNLKTLTLTLADDVERRGPAHQEGERRRRHGGRHRRRCRRPRSSIASHHILTLQDDRDLNVELYVNKGRGYVEADQHPLDRGLPVDLVRIDSIYNPVRRANFAVAETRVGQRTDYDRLTLTVETNGTISPEEAVSYAAALAQTHFQYFVEFGSHSSAPLAGGSGGRRRRRDGASLRTCSRRRSMISSCRVRSVNSLKNSNIRSLGDLVQPDGEPDPAGQEFRQEVAPGDRRSPRA